MAKREVNAAELGLLREGLRAREDVVLRAINRETNPLIVDIHRSYLLQLRSLRDDLDGLTIPW
jgi:hypothetical protein